MNRKMTDQKLLPNKMHAVLFSVVLAVIAVFASGADAAELTILYSNDIRGEIEPCG
jgi:hypothetical protein